MTRVLNTSQVTHNILHSQDMHETQSGIRLLITTIQRLTIWCRYGELIMLADPYIIYIYGANNDKESTYNSNHQYANRMTAIRRQLT